MTYPAAAFARELIAALAAQGVTDYVLCPGSRSGPLAHALAEAASDAPPVGAPRVNLYVRIDERSARKGSRAGRPRVGRPMRPRPVRAPTDPSGSRGTARSRSRPARPTPRSTRGRTRPPGRSYSHSKCPGHQAPCHGNQGVIHRVGGKQSPRAKSVRESLSLIHISEPTRRTPISYAVFCLKKK